ncbi:MAG: 30S ribosomal protein S6 [Lentisphaerae bacterium]|nr:30S ribosomal protein S6 [Lentisphaerota bacterium]
MKTYDGLFIFDESLDDNALEAALERAGAEIERVGGTVKGRELMGRRAFARPIRKRTAGLYVWVTFEAPPQEIAALRGRYKLNEDIVRVQVELARPRKAAAAELGTEEEGGRDGES